MFELKLKPRSIRKYFDYNIIQRREEKSFTVNKKIPFSNNKNIAIMSENTTLKIGNRYKTTLYKFTSYIFIINTVRYYFIKRAFRFGIIFY